MGGPVALFQRLRPRTVVLVGAWTASLLALSSVLTAPSARAKDVERVISRESPAFDVALSRLSIGLDGRAYLVSDKYVLSVRLDGSDPRGGEVTHAVNNVAVDGRGLVATANANFVRAVIFWDPHFKKVGEVSDFLDSDDAGWTDPSDVEAGPSGDFYAIDQFRQRVLRVAPPGRVVSVHRLDGLGENLTKRSAQLRVWERGARFYVSLPSGTIQILSFDGKALGSIPGGPTESDGWHGGFDVAEDGRVFVLADRSDVVRIYDPDGKDAGQVRLHMDARIGRVADMRLAAGEFVVKRRSGEEMFEVYRATGALERVVPARLERVRAALPDGAWVSGTQVSLPVHLHTSVPSAPPPRWRAWLRPFGNPRFEEVPWHDGALALPEGLGGVYQLRVTPDIQGSKTEYTVDEAVEIRSPSSIGSISIATPLNRIHYGQGEPISLDVVARAKDAAPGSVRLKLIGAPGTVAAADVPLAPGGPTHLVVPPELTRALPPGEYCVTADAPGFTVASQTLEIGLGPPQAPTFGLVQYGDYRAGFPGGDAFDSPENVERQLERSRRLGVNMFVDRLGHDGAGVLRLVDQTVGAPDLAARLQADPAAVFPGKATLEGPVRRTLAAYGSAGIEERGIALANDAYLPLGNVTERRSLEQVSQVVTRVSTTLSPYPAFRGWSWAANWWPSALGAAAANGPAEKAAYEAALKAADATGAWSPVLDTVSDRVIANFTDAARRLRAALNQASPGKVAAMTGPYRSVGVVPPISLRDADEVDLQFQSEQIQPPDVTPENVDFYKRPNKRAWGHPEIWNDDGTGGMLLPVELKMAMRGADGVGWSGPAANPGTGGDDPRATGPGFLSVLRSLDRLLAEYGPWLTTLHADDPVAIVVSARMLRIDRWGRFGGTYFDQLYEAYATCLAAHRPASFVFSDDLSADVLKGYRAVLVVGQRVEFEPLLLRALREARAAGVAVFYDPSSRPNLVSEFTPLGFAFDRVERDPGIWQDDSAYLRLPRDFREEGEALARALGARVAPVAEISRSDIVASERRTGQGRFVWVINEARPDLDPALAWRTGLIISQRLPEMVKVRLGAAGSAIYDVFGLRREGSDTVDADLRSAPARLYAILPRPIDAIAMAAPSRTMAGRPFAWSVEVRDAAGRAIQSGLPVQAQLLDAGGRVLKEEALATDEHGRLARAWVAPLMPGGGRLTLRATELVSGRSGDIALVVDPSPIEPLFGPVPDRGTGSLAPESRVLGQRSDTALASENLFGAHFKEIIPSVRSGVALINAMDWDENLYALDLETGATRWRRRIGDHFAYQPRETSTGFAVQGFDRGTPEGYHLYALAADGTPHRRFALYGLSGRATDWAVGARLISPAPQLLASRSGGWVASSGELGLAVWDAEGHRLWGRDGGKRTVDRQLLAELGDGTLVSAGTTPADTTVTAARASDGAKRWALKLDDSGTIQGLEPAPDGRTIAIRANGGGGRVFVVRDGKVLHTIPTASDRVALASDGHALAVIAGPELRWYVDGALVWTFRADDVLGAVAIDADARRLVVGSEMGMLYVLATDGRVIEQRDYGALPVGAWLPGGHLLVATWMGDVERLDANLRQVWKRHVTSQAAAIPDDVHASGATPTTRVESWGNASDVAAPLQPSLLVAGAVRVSALLDEQPQELQNDPALLFDGSAVPPAKPWLPWTILGHVDSGWHGHFSLELDAFRSQCRVTGITLVEDPAHPESWLREAELQYWDRAAEAWRAGPMLISDKATHTHWFDKPVEGSRFRLVTTGSTGWPAGNLRLGEVVLHGTVLGGSHPDVLAKRAVAVLFDEREKDAEGLMSGGGARPFRVARGGAYSGDMMLELTGAGGTGPAPVPLIGNALPDWDFEVVEHPAAGQYRYLQFAWKATSPATTGMSLVVGPELSQPGYAVLAGQQAWRMGLAAVKQAAAVPTQEWQVVTVDLWKLAGRPFRIQALGLAAAGGGAAFDRILLARDESDLGRFSAVPAPGSAPGKNLGAAH